MCLATVFDKNDDTILLKNVSRIDVDGDQIMLRDILGEEKVIKGSIVMVDLAGSVVKINCQ